MWTERDDDLPAVMAEMLTAAIVADMLETTKACWQSRIRGELRRRSTLCVVRSAAAARSA
jgi:hypothetical protein